ncbi:LysR family transcriptional regulator [Paracoccus zhejiangensis]|uniref:LysR family transcriptional regulator n=1 Tax=Paracoccus zhejiangensis TaxID=1077935 RepID=A0A2H5EZS3_9RHOB|nr:LysR family transcriptional regulator [Paracoccus zhejiangensis]AUH64791.1 LysR family transcriptional regulator [Paracoccus zhejiangensis]
MIDKLEMFLAVAKEGHFGRAAQSLGITQPSLSAGIKQLEGQLGVLLILRGSRYGGLTPEGETALLWAKRIVGDARQLREEMRVARHGLAGRLRIAVIPTALPWAARISAHFRKAHPHVEFTFLSRTSIEILQMLDGLEVDAGISYLDNEPLGKVTSVRLYNERYMIIAREDHPFAKADSLPWSALDGQPLCLLTADMQNRRIINRAFAEAGIVPRVAVEANSTIVMVSQVLAENALTILPEGIAAFLTEGKPLKLIALEGATPNHAVGLIAPWRDPEPPAIKALLTETRRLVRASDDS